MYPRSNRHIAGTDGIVFAGCWLVPRHAIGTPLPAFRDTNGTPLLRSLCLASVLNRFTGHEASLALRSRNAFSQRQELFRKSMLSRTPLFKSVAASHRGWIVAAYALPGKRMACRRQQASQPASQPASLPAKFSPLRAAQWMLWSSRCWTSMPRRVLRRPGSPRTLVLFTEVGQHHPRSNSHGHELLEQ